MGEYLVIVNTLSDPEHFEVMVEASNSINAVIEVTEGFIDDDGEIDAGMFETVEDAIFYYYDNYYLYIEYPIEVDE